jgi:hypothetical protein
LEICNPQCGSDAQVAYPSPVNLPLGALDCPGSRKWELLMAPLLSECAVFVYIYPRNPWSFMPIQNSECHKSNTSCSNKMAQKLFELISMILTSVKTFKLFETGKLLSFLL